MSGTAATSYSGAGLSSTAAQSLSGGAWFLSDTSSGCRTGGVFAFRTGATTGDWAPATAEPTVRGRARVTLLDEGEIPELGWNEQEDSCPRRLQEVQGCWRSHRSLECRQCWQLTGCRLRRWDARVCLLSFDKFIACRRREIQAAGTEIMKLSSWSEIDDALGDVGRRWRIIVSDSGITDSKSSFVN